MNDSDVYVIKNETILFLPEYDQFGNLSTVLMEDGKPLSVGMSPTELIDYNLRYNGSSLRGANDGSKMILGDIRMYPIVVNERLGLYWFPGMAPTRKDCVWFALHHIRDYAPFGKKQTKVLLSNGSIVIIDVSTYSFDKKVQRAYLLKWRIESRAKQSFIMTRERGIRYRICKKKDGRNYELGTLE